MLNKKDYFQYAQKLSNQYSTFQSNKSVEKTLLKTFNGKLPIQINNNLMEARVFLNDFLLKYYPNETAVKSIFINKVLSKNINHVSIFELNVGQSRIDLCTINRHSTAFEIKTELDTPKRLLQQMEDYFKVFEHVYIICSVNNLEVMQSYLPVQCGIYTYRVTNKGKYIFKKIKSAEYSKEISSFAQLSSMTKKELSLYFNCPYLKNKNEMINFIINNFESKKINTEFKNCLKEKFYLKWNYLMDNSKDILEIDYQWFFKNNLPPKIVYL